MWPTLIVFFIFANLFFSKEIGWYDFIFAGDYWFVRCFIVSFSIIYFMLKYLNQHLKVVFIISIILTAIYVLFSPKENGSIYHAFHYTCYFSSMMLGVNVGLYQKSIKNKNLILDLVLCLVSFISYFLIMFFGKGKNDNYYYVQLLAIIPLLSFLFYSYKVVSYEWCNKLANYKIWSIIIIVSSLTYEIYIVQFDLITGAFNKWYPFNTVIMFVIIVCSAYILRVLTNFIVQLFSNKDWNFKQIFSL